MKPTFQPLNRRRFIRGSAALGLLVGLLWAPGLRAQTPEEHASHHPGQAGGAMPAAGAMPATPGATPGMGAVPTGGTSPAPAATPGSAGGMGATSASGGSPAPGGMGPPAGVGPPGGAGGMGGMGDMGAMMKNMGVPPPKELYPTLMALPELSPEQRTQVEVQAIERMHTGTVLMGQALDVLNASAQSGDYAAMHEAMIRLREGAAQLESGIAARRALAEGRAPRAVALAWFKRDMNLLPLAGAGTEHSGLDVYHWFVMVLLIAFALAMVAMYFFKMRRAAALFGRIEADKGSPPPGSAPELAGGKPPDGKKTPSGDKPVPADKPAVPADKPAAGDKPPSGDTPPSGDKPPAGDKPPSGDKPAAAASDKLAAAADKLVAAAEKLAAAADNPPSDNKPAAADKPSGKKPPRRRRR